MRLIASLGARPDELMRDIGKAIGANPAQTASEGDPRRRLLRFQRA